MLYDRVTDLADVRRYTQAERKINNRVLERAYRNKRSVNLQKEMYGIQESIAPKNRLRANMPVKRVVFNFLIKNSRELFLNSAERCFINNVLRAKISNYSLSIEKTSTPIL